MKAPAVRRGLSSAFCLRLVPNVRRVIEIPDAVEVAGVADGCLPAGGGAKAAGGAVGGRPYFDVEAVAVDDEIRG